MKKDQDLTGQKFGMLNAIRRAPDGKHGVYWTCVCDCGKKKDIWVYHLLNGRSKSCGCQHGCEPKHGHNTKVGATPEYKAWNGMHNRCKNQHPEWHRYGGRGISVCERWSKFESFLEDMGPRPSHRHSLDRIDNDGNYEPQNCRWATREQQAANTSRSVRIAFRGEELTAAEWAKKLGMKERAIVGRLWRGLPVEAALDPRRRKGGPPKGSRVLVVGGKRKFVRDGQVKMDQNEA